MGDTAERHTVKMIAGKIIPALATTTAMITGLVTIEMLKLCAGHSETSKFRNSYCNLGIPQILNQSEPFPAKQMEKKRDPTTYLDVIPVPDGWTSWDKVKIQGKEETTIEEFCKMLEEQHHGVKCTLLFKYGITSNDIADGKGQAMWNGNPYIKQGEGKKSMKEIAAMPLKKRYEEIYGEVNGTYLILDVDCETKDGDSAVIPKVKFSFQ